MIEWDAYSCRLRRKGDTQKQRVLTRLGEKIRHEAEITPGCVEVLVNDVPQYIFTKRTDAPTKKNFNTLPGEELNLGSVVYWENRHWLVTESLCDDRLTYHGSIEQCNRQLVWQNKETREIIKRWCTIAKPYYSNLDSNLKLTISSREFKVQLPSDCESNLIDVDQRFMLEVINGEPKVYKCTSTDMNTRRYDVNGESVGFLILNIEQCQYDPATDNIEYGICDYLEPYSLLKPTKLGTCVLDASRDEIVPNGLPITLSARFFGNNGVPIADEQTIWTVNADRDLEDELEQEILSNGDLKLSMGDADQFIGRQFEVQAMNPDGSIYNAIEIKVVNGL